MRRVVGSASPMLRLAAQATAFATLYFLVAKLTNWLVGDPGIAVLWPASGVYLGVMLLAPRSAWPALSCAAGVGSLAAYLHGGTSIELSVAFAVPSGATGLFGALLVERLAGGRFRLCGLRDVVALVAGGAVVANALVALSAAAVAAQSFNVSFAESWLRWWSADALGVIAVAPILTAQLRGDRWRPLAGDLRASAGVAAGIGFAIYVALSLEPAGTAALVGGAIAFPVLLWAGWRWGPRAAAVGGLAVALAATHAALETYPVQGFLAVLLLGSLSFAAAIADRERDLARLNEELERRRLAADRTSHELEGTAEQLDQAGRRIARLTAELAGRSAELHEGGRQRDRLAGAIRDERAARAEAEHELEAVKGEFGSARQEVERLQRDLGSARREVERLERELALERGSRERALHKLDESAGALERVQARLDDTVGELARARAEGQALEENVEIARAEQARTSEQLSAAVGGRQRAEQQVELLSSRVDGLQGELERVRGEKAQSEQALADAHTRFAERRDQLQRSLDEAHRSVARAEAARRRLGDPETDMTARYDERGSCLYASPAFARLLAYEPGELLGSPGAELLHPEDRPRLVRARATGSQSTFEGRLRRKGGEWVWVEVSLDPVRAWNDARVIELKTTVRDISARRASEEPTAAWRDAYAAG